MDCFADLVAAALRADGWDVRQGGLENRGGYFADKVIIGWAAPGGAMVPDGRRRVRLQLDPGGRWLERVDGWGKVEKDVDLREFKDAAAAIAAALIKEM